MNLFNKPSVKEQARKQQKELKSVQRNLDREQSQLDKQEKQLESEIKKAAKRGDQQTAKQLAKQLIKLRQMKQKNLGVKTHIGGISHQAQAMVANHTMTTAIGSTTKIMQKQNQLMNVEKMQKQMQQFEMENAKMEMKEDLLNDTLDSVLDGSEDEMEGEEIMNQILDEIGLDIQTSTSAPKTKLGQQEVQVGQEEDEFPFENHLYVKHTFLYGPDWVLFQGNEEGISQQSIKPPLLPHSNSPNVIIWNFPLEVSFRSTNPFGWPQCILSVYGPDLLGRDVLKGYGSVHLPMTPGSHVLYVPTFAPLAASPMNQLLTFLAGKKPEFLDPKFPGKSDGREVTRVQSQGVIKLKLNILMKNIERLGFQTKS